MPSNCAQFAAAQHNIPLPRAARCSNPWNLFVEHGAAGRTEARLVLPHTGCDAIDIGDLTAAEAESIRGAGDSLLARISLALGGPTRQTRAERRSASNLGQDTAEVAVHGPVLCEER